MDIVNDVLAKYIYIYIDNDDVISTINNIIFLIFKEKSYR